jgi:membrane-associated HD superfamily phosphohydrolase
LPATREATIVSLADAIEAASRSLARVTPAHLENLVSTIVERKLLDGQLDASPLSFHELSAVKTSFVFTLTHLLHARIAYPGHAPHDSQPPASVPTALSAAS